MRVVGREVLDELCQQHADVRAQATAWLTEAEEADWRTPQDIKARFPSASFLAGNRVVFNLKGNSYRLVVAVTYKTGIVLIERAGTHAEYDRWQL